MVITPTENTVRMLNPVGSRIWQLADGTRTVDEIANVLVQEFDVDQAEAASSAQRFVAELVDLELLTWAE